MQYELTQESFHFNYNFGFILPTIPLPGGINDAFSILVKELKHFKVSTADINVENPSNKLNGFVMNINLLNNQIALRIAYEYFDVIIFDPRQINENYISVIDGLIESICKSFKSIVTFEQGLAKVHWRSLLQFNNPIPENFIGKQWSEPSQLPIKLIPNATIYKLEYGDTVNSTLVIANSEPQGNSLVIECALTYKTNSEPLKIISRFVNDLDQIMLHINLTNHNSAETLNKENIN